MTQAPATSVASSREQVSIFGTEENRAKLMAIYDEALGHWPVPFETFFVTTRYGKTHVIASGDPSSPPLVMTHPAAVGAFVWSSIIAPPSEKRRVYALDTIGDFGRSELADPDRYPKKGRDYQRPSEGGSVVPAASGARVARGRVTATTSPFGVYGRGSATQASGLGRMTRAPQAAAQARSEPLRGRGTGGVG